MRTLKLKVFVPSNQELRNVMESLMQKGFDVSIDKPLKAITTDSNTVAYFGGVLSIKLNDRAFYKQAVEVIKAIRELNKPYYIMHNKRQRRKIMQYM